MKNTLRPTALPVSAKYYTRLQLRVRSIIDALSLPDATSVEASVMAYIHHYFEKGTPEATDHTSLPYVIFLTLRAEIDTAITRSRRARECAARRRALCQSTPTAPEATAPEATSTAPSIITSTTPTSAPHTASSALPDTSVKSTLPASSEKSDLSDSSVKSDSSEKSVPHTTRRFRCGLKAIPVRSVHKKRKSRR